MFIPFGQMFHVSDSFLKVFLYILLPEIFFEGIFARNIVGKF